MSEDDGGDRFNVEFLESLWRGGLGDREEFDIGVGAESLDEVGKVLERGEGLLGVLGVEEEDQEGLEVVEEGADKDFVGLEHLHLRLIIMC